MYSKSYRERERYCRRMQQDESIAHLQQETTMENVQGNNNGERGVWYALLRIYRETTCTGKQRKCTRVSPTFSGKQQWRERSLVCSKMVSFKLAGLGQNSMHSDDF